MRRLDFPTLMICSLFMFFASCSKDESATVEEEEMAVLSFGTNLYDLMNDKQGLKQAFTDFPACSDAVPAYVAVVLSGTTGVGSMEDPLLIPLDETPGDYDNNGDDEYSTIESPDLKLKSGPYSLDFFAVYDGRDNLIWLAPTGSGDLAGYVNALPMDFTLGAGMKKYLDVNVLCFDHRFVNLFR